MALRGMDLDLHERTLSEALETVDRDGFGADVDADSIIEQAAIEQRDLEQLLVRVLMATKVEQLMVDDKVEPVSLGYDGHAWALRFVSGTRGGKRRRSVARGASPILCAREALHMLDGCECDNTHQAVDTVCRWCWERGRRHWDDPE